MSPEKPNAGKLVQLALEGFIIKQILNTAIYRHHTWLALQRKTRQQYLFHSETENMADSHPQTGFTELEPFLAHLKPQRCSSALRVSLTSLRQLLRCSERACVTLSGLTLPLRCPDWACVSPAWLLLPLRCP